MQGLMSYGTAQWTELTSHVHCVPDVAVIHPVRRCVTVHVRPTRRAFAPATAHRCIQLLSRPYHMLCRLQAAPQCLAPSTMPLPAAP